VATLGIMQPNQSPDYGPGSQQPYAGPQYAPGTHVDPRAQLTAGVDRFMAGVFAWMAAGLGITGAIAYALSLFPDVVLGIFMSPIRWVVFLAPLAFVWILASRAHRMSPGAALGAFFVYAAINGVFFAHIPLFFSAASIFSVFLVTGIMFGSTALFGYVTKKDLSGWGRFLFMALIGLIVAMVVSWFVPGMHFWIDVLGVLLFAGLTAYDTQKIRQIYLVNGGAGNLAILGALNLYLDFINIFIFLLHLFGGSRD
jgi:FtsH-binding integral membrane protein